MYEIFKLVVSSFLMPVPFVLALVFLGVLFILWHFKKTGVGFILAGAFCLFIFSWAPFADRVLAVFEQDYASFDASTSKQSKFHDKHLNRPVTFVVVLGGGWFPNNHFSASSQLSDSSLARLIEGIRIWRQFPNAQMVVSGASLNQQVLPVALGYRKAAMSLGVPKEHILHLDKPTDTGAEAIAFADWLHGQNIGDLAKVRFALVTSASHMPRAMRHFQAAGLNPIAAPTHFMARSIKQDLSYWVPSATHLRKTERAWYEFLASFAVKFEH